MSSRCSGMAFPFCQKAPSAKRCIKTGRRRGFWPVERRVRKHRAPKGALRLKKFATRKHPPFYVRKHRAPKGALRPNASHDFRAHSDPVRKHRAPKGALRQAVSASAGMRQPARQKAPSAKRCIKTPCTRRSRRRGAAVRKHRAPNGALRLEIARTLVRVLTWSESTERQTVH